MKSLEKYKKIMSIIFITFMIIQPIFDVYYLYSDSLISLFKFSPSTIIRMIIMSVLILFVFFVSKNRKKYIYTILFSLIYFLYTIFHHINCTKFNIPFNLMKGYSFISEIFYIIRMIMPLCLIFVTTELKPNWEKIKKVIIYTSLIFGIVMVVTNIFEVALTSYNDGNKIIKASIFDWFTKTTYQKFTYAFVASKGIFHMANQVSGILFALLPIVIYMFFEKETLIKYITIVLLVISMLMLGTRIASYGWLLVMVFMLILYVFFCLLKKAKINIRTIFSYILIVLIGLIILPYSPVSSRYFIEDSEEIVNSHIKKEEANSEYDKFMKYIKELNEDNYDGILFLDDEIKLKKEDFIEKYYNTYGIDKQFILDIYPYTEDCDFWLKEMSIPFSQRANHRQLKQHITKRVYELNNNKLDALFGLSFSRLRNGYIYMENDVFVHFYSIGVIGICLFILPYLLVLLYALYWIIRDKKNFNYLNITYMLSISLVFIAGVASGNIFDEWIITLFLGFICGILINNLNIKKNYKEKKVMFISSTGGHLNELLQLSPLIKKYNSCLITEKTKSNMNLKNKYDRVYYLVYGTRHYKFSYMFKFLYNILKSFVLYIKERPNVIITTGTHTAVPMCYLGKIFGSKVIFIETFANSKTKTLSGRLVYPIADTFIVQWKEMLQLYPKAIYGGWIY